MRGPLHRLGVGRRMDSEDEDLEDIRQDIRAWTTAPRSYVARRSLSTGTCEVNVTVDNGNPGYVLPPAREAPYNQHGFEWGFMGFGPRHLGYAILQDYLGRGHQAKIRIVKLLQQFCFECVAKLPHEGWSLHSSVIDSFLNDEEAKIESQPTKTEVV